MSGLFEHLAVTDDIHRVASRKALSLARARANNRFGRFINIANSVEEREARLALVAGDLEETVRQACADVDYPAWESVLESVQSHLGMVEAARRPKMCPYHREVMDISLAAGEPQAGFSAMAQHAWSSNHCQGEWEGGCNFKPEMTTQSYWDQKAEKAQERRRQREEQMQQEQVMVQTTPEENFDEGFGDEMPEPTAPEPSAVGMGAEPAQAEPQLAMAANTRTAATVPNPLVHGGSLAPLRQIAQKKPGLTVDGIPFEQWDQQMMDHMATQGMPQLQSVEVAHPHPTWEGLAADILRVGSSTPLKQYFQQKKQQKQQMGAPPAGAPAAGGQPMASRQAEALKTIDVDQGAGPSPKMDKRKWTPENVKFNREDAEMSGTPHPTREVDIAEPIDYGTGGPWTDDGRFDQTDAVLEKQDVEKGSDFSRDYKKSWPSGGDRSAVSATDPDKNPIREALLSEEEAERAINEFNQEG